MASTLDQLRKQLDELTAKAAEAEAARVASLPPPFFRLDRGNLSSWERAEIERAFNDLHDRLNRLEGKSQPEATSAPSSVDQSQSIESVPQE